MSWEMVDEGWGRRAADWAALAEPASCREYVAVHHRLGVDSGDRLLDMACGSGLALELAGIRGAVCAGIDASPRLAAVARRRNPESDIRVGDMAALPWDDECFDVVTSFRGIWGTTPAAVEEAARVLIPGGRLAITVWGNIGKSAAAWTMVPFAWATDEQMQHQADMVALGRPGIGESFLDQHGFDVDERFEVPCALEFADPEIYARSMAVSGPGYEAIQTIGEEEFLTRAAELARTQLEEGLPLRCELPLIGFVATRR